MEDPAPVKKNGGDSSDITKKLRLRDIQEKLEKNLRFSFSDLTSFDSFVKLIHQPRDASGLAVIRILFGFLMILDIHMERGLSTADYRWGNPQECRFPYFSNFNPLPLQWMCVLYFFMLIGASGIILGWCFKVSCLSFILPYWCMFLMDKTRWNNHSYLFGLITTQLMFSGADRCWSLDGRRKSEIRNTDIPLWNYTLLRGQVFLVYFIAGLKKTDIDWIRGYSMGNLGAHWVFGGFRLILNDDQISFFIVHLGGFFLDLTVGFFMILNFSRPYAYVFCGAFNLMNSRMFTIGMFPYVMIAVMPIFSDAMWPKKVLSCCPKFLQQITLYDYSPRKNSACVYNEQSLETQTAKNFVKKKSASTSGIARNVKCRHKVTAVLLCTFFLVQGFMPYSHWLTKGYNTWTSGLYGYSWDMMIHHWKYAHASVRIVEKSTGKLYYLNPEAWTRNLRWARHADMVKQYAHCVEQRLKVQRNITDIEIFVDIWISLNRRFTQRMYDPTVDILAAEWSPFREVAWVLPLMSDLTHWRPKLDHVKERIFKESNWTDVIFMADFPGYQLLNFVKSDIDNVTLEVMKGHVEVEFAPESTISLEEGQSTKIPSGYFHKVVPLRHKPACYMYTYVNTASVALETEWNNSIANNSLAFQCDAQDRVDHYFMPKQEEELKFNTTSSTPKSYLVYTTYDIWKRSITLLEKAFYSIITGLPMNTENMV